MIIYICDKQVIFEKYDGLITFVNINNNHWRFVVSKKSANRNVKLVHIM